MINKELLPILPAWKKRKRKELQTHWATESNRKKWVVKNIENLTFFYLKKHRYFATHTIINISKSNGVVNVVKMVRMTVLG